MEVDQLHKRSLKMDLRLTQKGQADVGCSLWISRPEAGK